MTYAETLDYLFARLPMYQRVGKAAYKADLSNTHALMEFTGHPERGLKCVHVAGTNGKGSTTHFIASVLQEAGYKVGLHTSPHLKDFRERFRINGVMIPEHIVTRFVEEYRTALEPIDASFFEWGVALAFWWFKQEKVDIAVIETGMGGRLDSTNVITPEVSVITTIGLDHMEFLGNTLEAIAGEKAGIIKPGIAVIIGEADGPVADVFRTKALSVNAPILFVDQSIPLTEKIGLHGDHQQRNARTAKAAIAKLQESHWLINEAAISAGLQKVVENTGLQGRWQQITPNTYIDVAHNADGFQVLLQLLKEYTYDHLHIVLGMVNDKDIAKALAILPKNATYYYCKADIPRGLDGRALQEMALVHGLFGRVYSSVSEAFSAARTIATDQDMIVVTGSVFIVAEVI